MPRPNSNVLLEVRDLQTIELQPTLNRVTGFALFRRRYAHNRDKIGCTKGPLQWYPEPGMQLLVLCTGESASNCDLSIHKFLLSANVRELSFLH
jgi:hypothetical protein